MFLEDSTFEIMELENDILYESIHLDILKSSIMEDIYIESDDSFFDKVKKFIRDMIEKIKKFFSNAKDAITNFFTRKNIDDKIEEIKEAIKENPELAKEKVTIPDHSELDKLYKDTINVLKDNSEATTKAMERYKKERDGLVKGTAILAATTVTLGAAVGIITHLKNNKIHDLEIAQKETETLCSEKESEIEHLKCEIDKRREENAQKSEEIKQKDKNIRDLNRDLSAAQEKSKIGRTKYKIFKKTDHIFDKQEEISKVISEKKDSVVAAATVVCDMTKSTTTAISGTFNAIANHPTHPIESIKSGAKKISTAIEDVVSGKALKEVQRNQSASREERLATVNSHITRLTQIIKSGKFSKDYPESKCRAALLNLIHEKKKLESNK